MTQEEFIKQLKKKKYSYKIEGDLIVVTHNGDVSLDSLTTLPADVKFENGGHVSLDSLTTLPPGVEFNNGGSVYLQGLASIPSGVEFNNGGSVNLDALTSISPGVEFDNGEGVWFNALIGGWFSKWSGNIKGIYSKRLLNLMIKKGIFQ
jgi:hypothetical protein